MDSNSINMSDKGVMYTMLCKVAENGYMPTRGSDEAIGYDLYCSKSTVLPKGFSVTKVNTNIHVMIPYGHYGRIAPRSSLALKGIDIGGGVIDSDYRGEVIVIMFNHTNEDYIVNKGDKIAQLILERADICELHEVDKLPPSIRDNGGFGSTGK